MPLDKSSYQRRAGRNRGQSPAIEDLAIAAPPGPDSALAPLGPRLTIVDDAAAPAPAPAAGVTPARRSAKPAAASRETTRPDGQVGTTHDWPVARGGGFVGEIVDGFPYPRVGEEGQLSRSGEELRSNVLRLTAELRMTLHRLQRLERARTGHKVEMERILDCALVRVPVDLDELARFVDETPAGVRLAQPSVDVGTRLRGSLASGLDELRERLGEQGRPAIMLTHVHRAALYHYAAGYDARVETAVTDNPG